MASSLCISGFRCLPPRERATVRYGSHTRTASSSTYEVQPDSRNTELRSRAEVSSDENERQPSHLSRADQEVNLDDLTAEDMQQALEEFNEIHLLQQQRRVLASKADFLKEQLEAEIDAGTRRIEPYNFHWQERPWDIHVNESNPPNSRRGNNTFSVDEMWSALRHVEVREFPLECQEVSDKVFEGLTYSMVMRDLDGISQQWRERCQMQERNSQRPPRASEIGDTIHSSARHADYHDHTQCSETCSLLDETGSLSADSETLFASSQNISPLHTPNHYRARSANDLGIPRRNHRNVRAANKKTISQRLLERELNDANARLRVELDSKFRATPVPASSILPRYNRIMQRMGNKSAESRRRRAAEILANMKPFSFVERSNSRPTKPRAREFIEDAVMKVAEGQEKKRALRPTTCRLMETAAEDGRRRRRLLEGLTSEHVFKPKIKSDIPNFKKKQEEFERGLEQLKSGKPSTKVDPFVGLTQHAELSQQKAKDREIKAQKKGASKPTFTAREIPDFDQRTETKHTRSSLLKQQTRIQAEEMKQKTEEEQQRELYRRSQQVQETAKIVQARLKSVWAAQSEVTTDRGLEDKEKKEKPEISYKRDLQEIKHRLGKRLCLFEQVTIQNAKARAESQFDEILKKHK
ncbi:hypothetical protein HDU76_007065 [Blyttiomyces sp. JEL0837]|nr:hypothetical protein HDU76_007065 [Blyttiomyces sp. JEL0837]